MLPMNPQLGRVCQNHAKHCMKYWRLVLSKSIGYSSLEKELGAPDPVVDESDDKTNISRLPKHLRSRMEAFAGPLEADLALFPLGGSRMFLRMWYARHGEKTGIDPSICFPTKEEMQEIVEDEKEWEPTLQERWATVQAQKVAEAEKRRKHEQNVEQQMAKMPQYIEQYKKKLKKEEDAVKKLEEKKQVLLQEARDFYGYTIDANDPRFHQLQEKKEEEELAAKKKKKKEEKKARQAEAMRKLMSLKS